MSRRKLTEKEISEWLEELENWEVEDKFLKRSFDFENFAEALTFVNKVGEIAEKADHHPDITFGWGYADIELTTHDSGGLTKSDFELAEEIEGI